MPLNTCILTKRASIDERIAVARRLEAAYSRYQGSSARRMSRLAVRWLFAFGDQGFDVMARLQVLEAFAGHSKWGKWSKHGDRGLAMAQEDLDGQVPVEWFQPGNSGMWGVVKGEAAKILRSAGGYAMDVDDLMVNGLMGLGKDGKSQTPWFFAAAKNNPDRVAKGTPKKFAATAMRYFKNRALNEVQLAQVKKHVQDHEEATTSIVDQQKADKDAPSLLEFAAKMMLEPGTRLGQGLRKLFLSKARGGKAREVAERYLNTLSEPNPITKRDLAKDLGINEATLGAHLRKMRTDFMRSLPKSPIWRDVSNAHEMAYGHIRAANALRARQRASDKREALNPPNPKKSPSWGEQGLRRRHSVDRVASAHLDKQDLSRLT